MRTHQRRLTIVLENFLMKLSLQALPHQNCSNEHTLRKSRSRSFGFTLARVSALSSPSIKLLAPAKE
jgi:hypothetical protein